MAYNRKTHLRDNIEAIRLMFRLERERRAATPEEQAVLAAYSGFGGIKAVLSPFGKLTDILRWTQSESPFGKLTDILRWTQSDRELFPLVSELHGVLREGAKDEREYKRLVDSVKASTFTAFYTPLEIISAVASSLEEHGVSPHRFLDPSSGTGNFLSAFQPHFYNATAVPEATAYEKDLLTGRILCRASRSFPRRTTDGSMWRQATSPSATSGYLTRRWTTVRLGVSRSVPCTTISSSRDWMPCARAASWLSSLRKG